MNKKEERLLGLACFFGGMVAGFLLAPIKKGIYCGNNTGNTVGTLDELEKINKNNENDEEENNSENK